jgi:hypothetical protein
MLLGNFKISNHAYEMYDIRVHKTRKSIGKAINHDLRTLNIRNIIRTVEDGKQYIYIFTRNFKEFIFVQDGSLLILKTVIKRNSKDTHRTIEKRKYLSKKRDLVTV